MITLVLGGVRSGKSEVAEQLAGPGPGTYLATGLVAPGDDDFADRVARHRSRRPASWATVEETRAVPAVLARLHGLVLLDALGPWIANDIARADIDGLVEALRRRPGDTVVVSEEVGLGVHPVTEVGRLFADRLGEANRRVAEVADHCLLVVAGRIIELPAGEASGVGCAAPGPPPPTPHAPAHVPGTRHPAEALPPFPSGPTGAGRPRPLSASPPAAAGPTGDGPGSPSAPPPVPTRASGLSLGQAVAFLTPLGGAVQPSPSALAWFPVVGAMLGLGLGGIWWAADHRLGALAAAALVVVADLAATGALHFDGLLDSADGLLPHLPPARRLAVMADPHVGAFAVAVGAGALLLRTASLAAFGSARPWLLAALWSLARTAMAVTALTGRYARPGGLASAFLRGSDGEPAGRGVSWAIVAALGTMLAVGLALADQPASVLAVLVAALAAGGVAALARRRIGGFTGDTLGAAAVVAETAGLLVAVAVVR